MICTKDTTYIVIDESGATHQKENDYFIIAGYITKQIYSVKSTHKKIEKILKQNYPYLNKYRNSNEHREVQMADLISNVMFGYYNFRTEYSAYNLIPLMKNTIISKFPYKYFKEPNNTKNKVDKLQNV